LLLDTAALLELVVVLAGVPRGADGSSNGSAALHMLAGDKIARTAHPDVVLPLHHVLPAARTEASRMLRGREGLETREAAGLGGCELCAASITRVFAAWYLLHQDSSSSPTVNFNVNNPDDTATNEHIDVQDDHFKVVREIGAAPVLLKNKNGALPLKRPRSIFLAGSDSGPAREAGPNAFRDQTGNDGILAMGGGSG
ncbi:hypothetical protein C0992_008274, partial [Termitomyces sp. T32_za158]